jgi:hypothetical protein
MTQKFKETAFMIGFLIYLLILYLASAKLSAGSRAFPMAVIVISLIAVGLKLLTLQFKGLQWLDPSGNVAAGIIEKASEGSELLCEAPTEEQEVKQPKPPPALTIVLFLLWLITFAAGIYFIGFLPTMAVWLFIFMVGISKIKWTRALLLSVCTFAVLYLSFVTLLGTNFSRGILF